ncbi:MAG: hypothetical protein IJ138_06595 [Clostridia bacterium]|nr:hypothetical protein [Clostridia bacterium]
MEQLEMNNGSGTPDLNARDMETCEKMQGRSALYRALEMGMQDAQEERTRPFAEAMAELQNKRVNQSRAGCRSFPTRSIEKRL